MQRHRQTWIPDQLRGKECPSQEASALSTNTSTTRTGGKLTTATRWPATIAMALSTGLLLSAGLVLSDAAVAQSTFPSRPMRIVSPFAAGSAGDLEARYLAEKMSEQFGIPVVVENQPGAGGATAERAAASAPPDGHTLGWVGNNTAIGVSLFAQRFDPSKEMTPVVGISEFAFLFVVDETARYRTLQDVIGAARSKPGSLNVGTSSVGTTDHFVALLFRSTLGLDFTVVPYRGTPELSVALLRNDIDLFVNSYGALRQPIADKRMRALATTGSARPPELPAVPTMKEAGVSDLEVKSWNAFYAARSTPVVALETLRRGITEILSRKDVQDRLLELGFEAYPQSAEQIEQRMRADIDRWAKVIADAGLAKQ
jgi:tripartite-type tricarboxylate transporter receptor subunit TctC